MALKSASPRFKGTVSQVLNRKAVKALSQNSTLANDEHPERIQIQKKEKVKEEVKEDDAEDISLKKEDIEAVEEQVTGES